MGRLVSFMVLKNTTKMIADIGTKALPDGQFEYLRDEMNGYSLVKANHPSYELPSYVYNGVMTEWNDCDDRIFLIVKRRIADYTVLPIKAQTSWLQRKMRHTVLDVTMVGNLDVTKNISVLHMGPADLRASCLEIGLWEN